MGYKRISSDDMQAILDLQKEYEEVIGLVCTSLSAIVFCLHELSPGKIKDRNQAMGLATRLDRHINSLSVSAQHALVVSQLLYGLSKGVVTSAAQND